MVVMSKKIIFTAPPELHEALKKYADDHERDMAWIVRRALAAYLTSKSYDVERVHPATRGGYRENAGRKPGT
jgi:predicted transcriptional regulator